MIGTATTARIYLHTLAVAALATACGSYLEGHSPPALLVADDAASLNGAVSDAVDFWEQHGAVFALGLPGGLLVELASFTAEADRLSQCGPGDTIFVDERLTRQDDEPEAACVIAHELGHALGMQHVEQGPSLMAPVVTADPRGRCWWSALDEDEWRYDAHPNTGVHCL